MNYCLTLCGEVKPDISKWWEWYEYSLTLIRGIGLEPNYIGVISESFKSGKMTTIKKTEAKLKKVIDSGECLKYLGVMVLPSDFSIAAYDFSIHLERIGAYEPHNITLAIKNAEIFKTFVTDDLINELKNFIDFASGQIYEIADSESPENYIAEGMPNSGYKELKVIKKL